MKKTVLLTFLVLCMMLSPVYGFGLENQKDQPQIAEEDFMGAAAALVSDTWRDNSYEKIELTIGDSSILVDNTSYEIDPGRSTQPQIINGRTMLPVRKLAETLGADVSFNQDDYTVKIASPEANIELKIGEKSMLVDGDISALDAEPIIINGRTYLPVRAIAESLGCDVEWKAEGTVTIKNPFQTCRLIAAPTMEVPIDWSSYQAETVLEGPEYTILQFASSKKCREAYESMSTSSSFVWVEPDKVISVDVAPNTDTATADFNWGVKRIGADIASERLVGSNKSVIVAVIDTGVDGSHELIRNRIIGPGWDFIDNDSFATDVNGHGTHVAGILAQCTPSNVQILPIKVLTDEGYGTDLSVSLGINYGICQNSNICNLSLSGGHSELIDSSIAKAVQSGIVVCVAAANDACDLDANHCCPAHCEEAITVSAINSQDRLASFSNYGKNVDFAAPGVDIPSSFPGDRYVSMSGTSMATPFVSAAAATLFLCDSKLSPVEIIEMLAGHADDVGNVGRDIKYGFGILNIAELVPKPEPIPDPEPEPEPIPDPEPEPEPIPDPEPGLETPYINICSITYPTILFDGDKKEIEIEILYDTFGKKCELLVGSNTEAADEYRMIDSTNCIVTGAGKKTINFSIIPKEWKQAASEIYICISSYPHGKEWTPYDSDTVWITEEVPDDSNNENENPWVLINEVETVSCLSGDQMDLSVDVTVQCNIPELKWGTLSVGLMLPGEGEFTMYDDSNITLNNPGDETYTLSFSAEDLPQYTNGSLIVTLSRTEDTELDEWYPIAVDEMDVIFYH